MSGNVFSPDDFIGLDVLDGEHSQQKEEKVINQHKVPDEKIKLQREQYDHVAIAIVTRFLSWLVHRFGGEMLALGSKSAILPHTYYNATDRGAFEYPSFHSTVATINACLMDLGTGYVFYTVEDEPDTVTRFVLVWGKKEDLFNEDKRFLNPERIVKEFHVGELVHDYVRMQQEGSLSYSEADSAD